MKDLILDLILKLITPEKIGQLVAKAIARLLVFAKGKNEKAWDKAKEIITQIQKWTELFVQVYEDDELSEAEEQLIANEIANMTPVSNIKDLVSKLSD